MARGSKRRVSDHKKAGTPSQGAGKAEALFRKPIVHSLIIVALGVLIYANTFSSPFAFDDIPNITDNYAVKDLRQIIGRQLLQHNRTVTQLTFALNYTMHGFDVAGYHAFNLLLHLFNALLVYWLTFLTFRTRCAAPNVLADPTSPASSDGFLPLFAALVFVSHPLQTQAVTYIVQRGTSLATLFYLLSLVGYIKARGAESSRKRRYSFYAVCIISAVLAMKSKEIAFTLPVMVVLYEFLFFTGDIKKRTLYLLSLLLTLLIIPFSYGALRGSSLIDILARAEDSAAISRWDYLNTQFRVIVTYIRLLLFPVNQNLDYEYPIYRAFFTPQVFWSFLLLLGIVCGGGYLLYRSYQATQIHRCRYRIAAFGVFWFFVTLSVESSIIPIADVINEHRLYLPSVGFFLAAVSGLAILHARLAERGKIAANAFVPIMIVVLIFLSVAAYARNTVWRDEKTLWEDVVRKSPSKLRPHYSLGEVYLKGGRFSDAITEYQTALQLDPDNALSHYNLGMAYQKQGRLDDAVREYQTAINLDPNLVKPHHNLGVIHQQRGNLDDAVREYQTAIKLNPAYPASYYNLGVVYQTQGRLDEAIREYQTAIRIRPDHADAHNDLGVAYEGQGRLDDAVAQYRRAIRIKPDHQNANNNLDRVTKTRAGR